MPRKRPEPVQAKGEAQEYQPVKKTYSTPKEMRRLVDRIYDYWDAHSDDTDTVLALVKEARLIAVAAMKKPASQGVGGSLLGELERRVKAAQAKREAAHQAVLVEHQPAVTMPAPLKRRETILTVPTNGHIPNEHRDDIDTDDTD